MIFHFLTGVCMVVLGTDVSPLRCFTDVFLAPAECAPYGPLRVYRCLERAPGGGGGGGTAELCVRPPVLTRDLSLRCSASWVASNAVPDLSLCLTTISCWTQSVRAYRSGHVRLCRDWCHVTPRGMSIAESTCTRHPACTRTWGLHAWRTRLQQEKIIKNPLAIFSVMMDAVVPAMTVKEVAPARREASPWGRRPLAVESAGLFFT